MKSIKMKKCYGFTLAEVLITLAIIGVVAALSIPAVISNSQQQEFKTGLRKAVSVLNSAITMNMALDGESPYDNKETFYYLQKHMNIMKSVTQLPYRFTLKALSSTASGTNAAFYTTDGMRFEMDDHRPATAKGPKLYESDVYTCVASVQTHYISSSGVSTFQDGNLCNGCGSYGLNHNPNNTTEPPCLIMVDVNGDKKPSPSNVNCNDSTCMANNFYTYPAPDSKRVTDIFAIMITEDRAVPFGVVAQRAMYQARK